MISTRRDSGYKTIDFFGSLRHYYPRLLVPYWNAPSRSLLRVPMREGSGWDMRKNISKRDFTQSKAFSTTSTGKNVQLNHSILAQIINNGLDISKVIAVGVGLDYKNNINESKVKCYLTVRGYPEKVEQVLSLHSPVNGIREYLVHEEFTFGIDMYFAGTTDVEIYLYLDRQDLNNTELAGKLKLRGTVAELIKECNFIHLSFESNGRRIVYFHPQRPTRFVSLLGSRRLAVAYSHVQILNYILSRSYKKDSVSVKLSLLEDEIASQDIQNVDLQYALTSRE